MARIVLNAIVLILAVVLTVALSVALSGCSTPEPFTPGAVVAPPAGWVDYCNRNPKDCK